MPIASVRPHSAAARSQPSDGNCDVDDDDEKLAAEAIKPVQFDSSADERSSTAHSRASLYSYELTMVCSQVLGGCKATKGRKVKSANSSSSSHGGGCLVRHVRSAPAIEACTCASGCVWHSSIDPFASARPPVLLRAAIFAHPLLPRPQITGLP